MKKRKDIRYFDIGKEDNKTKNGTKKKEIRYKSKEIERKETNKKTTQKPSSRVLGSIC